MSTNILIKIATGFLAIALTTACEIEKTQEGELPDVNVDVKEGNLPKYEVRQTEEGEMPEVDVDVKGGQIPKYDVDAPDIVVGTKEMEVEVPDVDVKMEKETIDVPVVGIDMPDEDDDDNEIKN